MPDEVFFKYAVLLRDTKLRLYLDILSEGDTKEAECNEITILAGALIKIFQLKSKTGVDGCKNISTVQVLDLVNNTPAYQNLFECPQDNLLPVDESLWPFVISIEDNDQRLRMLKDVHHCKWVMQLGINNVVRVSGEMFNRPRLFYNCIVRYIGIVEEVCSVGYIFGLELLDLSLGSSPQAHKSSIVNKYMKCTLPDLAIFTTANWLKKIQSEYPKEFSPCGLINGAIEKVKSIIGPGNSITGSYRTNNKHSTAQFFVDEISNITVDTCANNNNIENKMERSKNELLNSEEFKQPIENSEKYIERRATSTAQTQTQPQSGILKHKHKDQPSRPQHVVIDHKEINCQEDNFNVINGHDDSNKDLLEFLPAVLDNDGGQWAAPSLKEVPNTDLGLGSLVEVKVPDLNKYVYGVIRWIGVPPDSMNLLIGVELEEDFIGAQLRITDGGYNGISYFKCPVGRGIFITSDQCSLDRRFVGADGGAVNNCTVEVNDNKAKTTNGFHDEQQTFGHMECPTVPGAVAPIKCSTLNALKELCGKFKGIQGHNNSCYLDVTLFSMFAFTPVFDAILYRPPEKDDISHYVEVQTVLREEIVNPLRKHMFVRADRVMKLRHLLDKLSSVSGLISEEKDPEELLNCVLSQIMRAEPFLKLNSGQDAYYYQLFMEKDERLSFPSVQQLFEQSFYTSDIKLKEVPSCLIIQMPRFGKSFKMYPRILPSQVLDVTDIIEDSPRQCTVCGKLAEYECRDCFGVLQNSTGLESTSFCPTCLKTVHTHAKRSNHKNRKLSVPNDFRVLNSCTDVPRLYMELFAVLCIETSHYVAFVKSGSGPDAPWCFFDSMADRKGELNGYNIPEMKPVPDLPQWLSEDGARSVNETSFNDKMLPDHAKRLFCDAYMCMYQSTDVMMYR